MASQKIAVVGCGNVGFAHLSWLAKSDHNVLGLDPSIEAQSRIAHALGKEYVARDWDSLSSCSAVHICVPTDPKDDGSTDLRIFGSVVERLASLERSEAALQFVSQRSTCPAGTADRFARYFQRAIYGVNPSFLRKSSITEDTLHPERIAYGGPRNYIQHLTEIYGGLDSPVFESSSRSLVELLKYVENALDSVLLSFWNEIVFYAEQLSISGQDFGYLLNRIGDRSKFAGAARVPARGFGMWCLPKDLQSLLHEMRKAGCPLNTLEGARETNGVVISVLGEGELGSTQLFDCKGGQIRLSAGGFAQIASFLRKA